MGLKLGEKAFSQRQEKSSDVDMVSCNYHCNAKFNSTAFRQAQVYRRYYLESSAIQLVLMSNLYYLPQEGRFGWSCHSLLLGFLKDYIWELKLKPLHQSVRSKQPQNKKQGGIWQQCHKQIKHWARFRPGIVTVSIRSGGMQKGSLYGTTSTKMIYRTWYGTEAR